MRKLRTAISLVFVIAFAVCGVYVIKYKVMTDQTPPVISCEKGKEEITVSVNDEEAVLLDGLTASDNRDGDLTDDIRIASMSNFITDHKRTVRYVVFDRANLAGTFERTIQYSDYTAPRIHLSAPLRFKAGEEEEALYGALTAEDPIDGDITQNIRVISTDYYYDTSVEEYAYTLQVSSSAGTVCSVPVTVTVMDSSSLTEREKYYPLLSEYIFYTSKDTAISPENYIIGLEHNESELLYEEDEELRAATFEDITVSTDANYAEPGVYTVEYSYMSKDGTMAVTKAYIVVEDV